MVQHRELTERPDTLVLDIKVVVLDLGRKPLNAEPLNDLWVVILRQKFCNLGPTLRLGLKTNVSTLV